MICIIFAARKRFPENVEEPQQKRATKEQTRAHELKEEAHKIMEEIGQLRAKWREVMKQWLDELQKMGDREEETMENITSKFHKNFYMKYYNFIINIFLFR